MTSANTEDKILRVPTLHCDLYCRKRRRSGVRRRVLRWSVFMTGYYEHGRPASKYACCHDTFSLDSTVSQPVVYQIHLGRPRHWSRTVWGVLCPALPSGFTSASDNAAQRLSRSWVSSPITRYSLLPLCTTPTQSTIFHYMYTYLRKVPESEKPLVQGF